MHTYVLKTELYYIISIGRFIWFSVFIYVRFVKWKSPTILNGFWSTVFFVTVTIHSFILYICCSSSTTLMGSGAYPRHNGHMAGHTHLCQTPFTLACFWTLEGNPREENIQTWSQSRDSNPGLQRRDGPMLTITHMPSRFTYSGLTFSGKLLTLEGPQYALQLIAVSFIVAYASLDRFHNQCTPHYGVIFTKCCFFYYSENFMSSTVCRGFMWISSIHLPMWI